MARAGITKFRVQQARDALIAKGQHPSLDAIRLALGNTGSRTTIHRYLRELEMEAGTQMGDHPLLSETLKELVERLAAQLQTEAQEPLEQQREQHAQHLAALQSRLAECESRLATCTAEQQRVQGLLDAERQAHQDLVNLHQQEQILSQRLAQEVMGLKDQLASGEQYRQSLEEKHAHARETLTHYRQSIQELRDQDQRRHEQQLQQMQAEQRQLQQSLVIKQSEVTELSKDNARLATELAETRKQQRHEQQLAQEQLSHAREQAQRLAEQCAEAVQKLEEIHQLRQRNAVLETQLAAQEQLISALEGSRDPHQANR
jgi:chromosome segregation ATPase